jgi:hypothetical protein
MEMKMTAEDQAYLARVILVAVATFLIGYVGAHFAAKFW